MVIIQTLYTDVSVINFIMWDLDVCIVHHLLHTVANTYQ